MQLDEPREAIAKNLVGLYAKHVHRRTKATIDDIMLLLGEEIRRYSTMFIVVDGLDECPEEGRVRATFTAKIRGMMTAVSSSDTKLQLIATSRSRNDVFDERSEIEVRATDEDIEKVVRQKFIDGISLISEINRSLNRNEALKLEIIDTIVAKAKNM